MPLPGRCHNHRLPRRGPGLRTRAFVFGACQRAGTATATAGLRTLLGLGPDRQNKPDSRCRLQALEDFHEDLVRRGLSKRRHYDARGRFISLGLDGGASKDLLQGITHPRPADAFDLYRTPAWAARCEAVSKLKVDLIEGEVLQLKLAAVSSGTGDVAETRRSAGMQNP